jgi:hypothetical protein
MVRLCGLLIGVVSLMGLAGCDERYRGYGSGYRPTSGGSYNRATTTRYRDNRSTQQNVRSAPGNSGNRGGGGNVQGGGGGGGSNRGNPVAVPGLNTGDPPANHQGN